MVNYCGMDHQEKLGECMRLLLGGYGEVVMVKGTMIRLLRQLVNVK